MQKIQYIEIIGTPGSGKTRAANLFLEQLNKREISAQIRSPLKISLVKKIIITFNLYRLMLFHLFLFLRSVRCEYKNTPHVYSVLKNIRWRFVAESAIVDFLIEQHKGGVLINDEGMIGKLVVFSILTKMSSKDVNSLLKKVLPKNSLIIYVDSPTDLAIMFANRRGTVLPFFDEMNRDIKKSFYEESNSFYKRIYRDIPSLGGMSSIRINNTGTDLDLEREVVDVVESQLAIFQQ